MVANHGVVEVNEKEKIIQERTLCLNVMYSVVTILSVQLATRVFLQSFPADPEAEKLQQQQQHQQ